MHLLFFTTCRNYINHSCKFCNKMHCANYYFCTTKKIIVVYIKNLLNLLYQMKNIINITIIILCTCIFYGCKKKDKPHGANIVRYKLNGVEKKIEGNYSSFSLEGILKNFSTNQRSFTAYSNDGG